MANAIIMGGKGGTSYSYGKILSAYLSTNNQVIAPYLTTLTGWSAESGVNTLSNNIITNTSSGADKTISCRQTTGCSATVNDKIFVYSRTMVTNSDCILLRNYVYGMSTFLAGGSVNNPTINTWYELYNMITIPTTATNSYIFYINNGYANPISGKIMKVDGTPSSGGCYIINMTSLGISNYTSAQMLDMIHQAQSYYGSL